MRAVPRASGARTTTPRTRARSRTRVHTKAKTTLGKDRDGDRIVDVDASDAARVDARARVTRSKRPTRRARVDVDSASVASARGTGEKTATAATEEAYVRFLSAYIAVIFAIGVVLGASAFGIFPESVDGWIEGTLYPFFTPFTGGFLVFSSAYGAIKTRDDPRTK